MSYVVPLLVCTATFLLGFVLGRRHRDGQVTFDLSKVRSSIQLRVAVHEAGHAVVAWKSPYSRITAIEMDEGLSLGSGRVLLGGVHMLRHNVPKAEWWNLAILLGGLAGELAELKKFRSGNCRADLENARQALRDIDGRGDITPPWPPAEQVGSFDVVGLYAKGSLSAGEEVVLRQAYAKARSLIEDERTKFEVLARHLLEKGRIDEAEVRRLLW